MKTKPDLHQFLIENGWKTSPYNLTCKKDYTVCYYKRFPSKRKCNLNKDKNGIPVQLTHSVITVGEHNIYKSLELKITGQLSDSTSVQLLNYALPYDINKVLRLIPRLIRIWETK